MDLIALAVHYEDTFFDTILCSDIVWPDYTFN